MTTVIQPARSAGVENAFKFLDYYTDSERDRASFGGRDADKRAVLAGILKDRTFVLYGRSGLGKTSLLLAGAFPELKAYGYRPIHTRLLQDPLADLCVALAEHLHLPSSAPDDLPGALRAATSGAPVVLVLDQFEEFFIRFRERLDVRARFGVFLGSLVADPSIHLHVVFSLREDYLGELDDLSSDVPGLLAHTYRLHPLSAFGARQAVMKSLVAAGVEYEQRLLADLVDLFAKYAFEPTMLQIVCYEVFEHAVARPERPVVLRAVDLVSPEEIFRSYLEDVIESIGSGQLLLVRAVLDALITPERTKRAVTLADLVQSAAFEAKPEEVARILNELATRRIVRRDERGERKELWYELSHEKLVPALLDWFGADDDFANFRLVRDLVATNCRGESWRRRPAVLLNRGLLDLVTRYRERLRLDPLQTEFVLWSAIYQSSDDLGHWASVWGPEKTLAILADLLSRPEPEWRTAAAAAVPKLDVDTERLKPSLLDLALRDVDGKVRDAAGATLVTIVGAAEVEAIRTALGQRPTRAAATQILVKAYEALEPLPIGWNGRAVLARVRARRWVSKRRTEVIRPYLSDVTRIAFTAGLVWTCSIGLPSLMLVMWWSVSDVDRSLPMVSLLAALSTLVGVFLARRVIRRAAPRVAGDKLRWFRAVLISGTWPFALVGVGIAIILWSEGDALSGLAAASITAMVLVAVAAQVAWSQPIVRSHPSETRLWLSAFVASSGFWLLVPVAVMTVGIAFARRIERFDADVAQGFIIGAFLATLVGTFLSLVYTATLARAFPATNQLPTASTTRRNRLALACCAVGVLFFARLYHLTSIPVLAGTTTLEAGTSVDTTRRIGPGWPDAGYVNFNVAGGAAPQWLRLDAPTDLLDVRIDDHLLWGPEVKGDGQYYALLASGRHTISFSNGRIWDGRQIEPRVVLRTVASGGDARDVTMNVEEGYVVQVPLQASDNRWRGRLQVTLKPGTWLPDQHRLHVTVLSDARKTVFDEGSVESDVFFSGALSREIRFGSTPLPLPDAVLLHATKHEPTGDDRYVEIGGNGQVALDMVIDSTNPVTQAAGLYPNFPLRRPGERNETDKASPPPPLLIELDLVDLQTIEQARKREQDEKIAKYLPRVAEAKRNYERNTSSLAAQNSYAWELCLADLCDEAVSIARIAISGSNNPSYLDTLAHAEYGAGHWKEAADAWERVHQIDSKFYQPPLDLENCKDDELHYADARQRAGMRPLPSTIPRGLP